MNIQNYLDFTYALWIPAGFDEYEDEFEDLFSSSSEVNAQTVNKDNTELVVFHSYDHMIFDDSTENLEQVFTAKGIPYVLVETSDEYNEQLIRGVMFNSSGETVEISFWTDELDVDLFSVVEAFDADEETRNTFLEKLRKRVASVTIPSWENQVAYGKQYLINKLIHHPDALCDQNLKV